MRINQVYIESGDLKEVDPFYSLSIEIIPENFWVHVKVTKI